MGDGMIALLRGRARRPWHSRTAGIAFLMTAVLPFQAIAQETFQFSAIGDTAYSKRGEAEFERMIDAMNKENLAFVVHVGDFQADPRPYERSPDRISLPCVDENMARVLASFDRSGHPFILTPGDNDWADCSLLKAQKIDPLEVLGKLRARFYPDGRSLGAKTIGVNSQTRDPGFAKFRENLTWQHGGVIFATFHTVGSNDNKGRSPEMDAEQAERETANIAWVRKAFAAARQPAVPGLVLITQANVQFENQWTPSLRERYVRAVAGAELPKETKATAYDPYVRALTEELETFSKPVLFIHGDTHLFRINKPLISVKTGRFFENFTRLEVFGDPESHWVRVTVDRVKPGLFAIEPEIIAENKGN
jgi:hypothetical protein